ncbi:PTS system enzyme IIBC components [Malacoplasma penetrans HF-2]|uniref:PTS system enzyme IIBC components n=2 Tax=Malacoplasma penetrans TaxID=28227 RepID=Q8EVV5_MALP2|nr:PTS system enzyme IIBC components [Malacoplasma penetrans HF-2]
MDLHTNLKRIFMDNKKITIYAPLDCSVYPIEKIEDKAFASKSLGEGVFIIPKKGQNKFYSFFEDATISLVADTKHAFFIKDQSSKVVGLIHIGLETVNFKGEPFNNKVKPGDKVNLNSLLTEVDLDFLLQKKITLSTPIVFDKQENSNWQFKPIPKIGSVKRGQPIGYLEYVENKETAANTKNEKAVTEDGIMKSKFQVAAENIYGFVGGYTNYTNYTNCMTRFRFMVNDKNKVEVNKIKEIPIVKGINWNGNELQIIIGGDVIRVRESFNKYLESIHVPLKDAVASKGTESKQESQQFATKQTKKGFRNRVLVPLVSCIMPILYVLLAAGIFKGIYSICNIIDPANFPSSMGTTFAGLNATAQGLFGTTIDGISGVQWFAYVLFVIGDVGINFLGILIFFSVVRYMKGDMISAMGVALVLIAPSIYGYFDSTNGTTTSWQLAPAVPLGGGFNITYSIQSYTNSVLVCGGTGVAYVYFDRWVKSWMPGMLDVVLRMALVILFTVVSVYFILGPALSVVQTIIGIIFNALSSIPYGIGVALFALLWQPLVLTGAHGAVAGVLIVQVYATQAGTSLMWGLMLGVFGQGAAGFAVAVHTKNSELRKQALTGFVPALLGITEPVIYGVILPKVKPFLTGCLAAGIGGLFAGIFGVASYLSGGQGILGVLGLVVNQAWMEKDATPINLLTGLKNDTAANLTYGVISILVVYGAALLFEFFLNKERLQELHATKKANNFLLRTCVLKTWYLNDQKLQDTLSKLEQSKKGWDKFVLKLYLTWLINAYKVKYLFTIKSKVNKLIMYAANVKDPNSEKGKVKIATSLKKQKDKKELAINVLKNKFNESDFNQLLVLSNELSKATDLVTHQFILDAKAYEKDVIIDVKLNTKFNSLSDKAEKQIIKIQTKIAKLKKQDKSDSLVKVQNLEQKLKDLNVSKKMVEVENKIDSRRENYEMLKNKLLEVNNQYTSIVDNVLKETATYLKDEKFANLDSKHFNAIHSVDVCYGKEVAKINEYHKYQLFNINLEN